jgi:hypothetical protein
MGQAMSTVVAVSLIASATIHGSDFSSANLSKSPTTAMHGLRRLRHRVGLNMDTEDIIVMALQARAAGEAVAAKRIFARNSRYAEFRKFYSGFMMVFTGLLLAAIYGLLTRQFHIYPAT